MKNRQLIFVFGILLILVLLTILIFSRPRNRFDWSPTFKAESKEPYGTYVIEELLRTYFPAHGFELVQDSLRGQLPTADDTLANYVFIGEALFLDSLDVEELLTFVENGNTAFISSRTIPYNLMEYLYYNDCEGYYWNDYAGVRDTFVRLNFNAEKFRAAEDYPLHFAYRNKPRPYNWSYIEDVYFCENESPFEELGRLSDTLINFMRAPYGEGMFYLHTTPIIFSNYHLLDSTNLAYTNSAFSYLPPGKIYWDEYSKTLEAVGRQRNNSQRRLSAESPLQYILSQPALTWAWYLLLAMGLLFLLFRTKRRQRVIPVLQPNTNTSLEFVSTIGRLYFLQNSHRKLALQKMKLFQNFVRERYQLRGHELDAEFIEKLIAKSEVSPKLIDKILLIHRNITNSKLVTENTLIDFHNLMDEFYRTCK